MITDPVIPAGRVGRPGWPIEPIHPTQGRQAQHTAPGPADLLVQVALLTTLATKTLIEPRPLLLPTRKNAKPLHVDFEGLPLRVQPTGIASPHPKRAIPPHWLLVCGHPIIERVVEHRPLDKIPGTRPGRKTIQ